MEQITSRKNPKIQHLKKLGSSKAYRTECGEFLCDGAKLLEEAVSNGAEITSIVYCAECPSGIPVNVPVHEVPRDLIDYISPMKTPQNVVFTCRIPDKGDGDCGMGRYVVLEGVQDPGNVGTVMRTARAMGYNSVILLHGCADLYSPKTVRSTMGAIFRQHAFEADLEFLSSMKATGVSLFGAALAEDSVDVRDVKFENFAVCIGSEGRGLSQELLELCDKKIIIPMMQECESLNAAMAAGIIMWESVR